MNKVILMGRLTRDAEIRYSEKDESKAIAKYTLAVDRRHKRDGEEQTADFINCVAFGKTEEFLERFGKKGIKFVVVGRIQSWSYTNKDGKTVYTTTIFTESIEFAESKRSKNDQSEAGKVNESEFMNISDEMGEDLPFN